MTDRKARLTAIVLFVVLIMLGFFVSWAHAEDRYFAVKAFNEWGMSELSPELKHDIPKDAKIVTLKWDLSEGATGYIVFWGKSSGEYIKEIEVRPHSTNLSSVLRPQHCRLILRRARLASSSNVDA